MDMPSGLNFFVCGSLRMCVCGASTCRDRRKAEVPLYNLSRFNNHFAHAGRRFQVPAHPQQNPNVNHGYVSESARHVPSSPVVSKKDISTHILRR